MTLRETIDKADNNSISTLLVADYLDKNFSIEAIEPFYFEGVLGAPVNNYVNTKLFFFLDLVVMGIRVEHVLPPNLFVYDDQNNLVYQSTSCRAFFDTVAGAAAYLGQKIHLKNVIASRLNDVDYDYYALTGYQLTINP